jgi:uncharacterized protein (TIGR02145 family)
MIRFKKRPVKIYVLYTAVAIVTFVTVAGLTQFSRAIQIDQVSPDQGGINGGETVTITGNFAPAVPTTMQEMTREYCTAMPLGSSLTLTDTRNSQTYQVRKLADDNCWMVDNLKLELTDGMVLTPADTAIANPTTVYFTRNTMSGGTRLPGMPVGNNFTTSGYLSVDGTSSTTSPNLNNWRQVNPTNRGGSHPEYGYLYNFYTATAGTGAQPLATNGTQATGSICPAGWRLPSATSTASGPGNGTSRDYADLAVLNASMLAGTRTLPGITTNDANTRPNWQLAGPFGGVYSGMWDSNYAQQGTYFYLWTSSVSSATSASYLRLYASAISPGTLTYGRGMGLAIRCVTDGDAYAAPPDPIVTFDGIPVTITAWDNNSITVIAPPHAAGLVDVVVTRGAEADTFVDGYRYVAPATAPPAPNAPNTGRR